MRKNTLPDTNFISYCWSTYWNTLFNWISWIFSINGNIQLKKNNVFILLTGSGSLLFAQVIIVEMRMNNFGVAKCSISICSAVNTKAKDLISCKLYHSNCIFAFI